MDYGMESFVAICKAANPEFKSWTLEDFEDNFGGLEMGFTCEVCGVLGLTRKVGGGWETMPHLHELLVEHAARQHEDISPTGLKRARIYDDPYLLRSIFFAAGWEEENEAHFVEFACNVLKVLGLVVGGPSDESWKPTTRLRNLVMSRLVQSLKADVRITKTDLPEVDDQYPQPNETWDGDETHENRESADNDQPESIFKRRNQMAIGKRPKRTGSITDSRWRNAINLLLEPLIRRPIIMVRRMVLHRPLSPNQGSN
jgi:hypothetical protein